MIRAFSVRDGRLLAVDDNLEQLPSVVWIDLLSPTPEEEAALEGKLGIPNIPTK